jgi:hypothetical protein
MVKAGAAKEKLEKIEENKKIKNVLKNTPKNTIEGLEQK